MAAITERDDEKYHDVWVSASTDGRGIVTLDGKRVRGVVGVSVESAVGEPTYVTVTFIANVNCVGD